MKEEALKLADELIRDNTQLTVESAYMIRRLVEELDKKSKPINHYEPTAWINHIKQTGGDFYELNVSGRGEPLYRHPPQTKPLSDDEIVDCVDDYFGLMALQHKYIYSIDQVQEYGLKLARAIEERHGIK